MKQLTDCEIKAVENRLGVVLPAFYRNLLKEKGYGESSSHKEIYNPEDIPVLYRPFFENPAMLFNAYFPFGCDNNLQEMWVIDIATGRIASIWHETVPEDWPDENWMSSMEWAHAYLNFE